MTDYLDRAKSAPSPKVRKHFLRLHQAQSLRDTISTCRACPLHQSRRFAAPWNGPTHGKALLVLAGAAPGRSDDQQGTPLAGSAGKLLDGALGRIGVNRSQIAALNTVNCRPPPNRAPESSEISTCNPHFESQLSIIGVGKGVVMGLEAASIMLNQPLAALDINELRGHITWRHDMIWSFTYHPDYLLDNRGLIGPFIQDLALMLSVGDHLDTNPTPPIPESSIDGGLGEGVWDFIRRRGYATVNLRRVGVTVIVVPDVRSKYRVPAKAGNYPIYTYPELIHLGVISRQHSLPAPTLKAMHDAKVAFNGDFLL